MPARNNAELNAMLLPIASNVIKLVSDAILTVLQRHIDDETYDPLPNADYYNGSGTPTFQFKHAFEFTEVQTRMSEVISELFYNWQSMSYDPDTFLHGSSWNGDMRERLADILNIDGSTGFSNKIRGPYWDNFIIELFDNGGFEKLFNVYMSEEFGKIGIRVVRG